MNEARRKQVVELLRKVASLLHTRGDKRPHLTKKAGYVVNLRAMRKTASMR